MKNIYSEKWEEYKKTGYYVSTYGGIRRKLQNGRWRYLKTDSLDRYGYPRVVLKINEKNKSISIHRMVAETFIPNPEGKDQVNHINGDKQNNRASNLEWVTAKENMEHCYKKIRNNVTRPIIRMSPDLKEFKFFPSVSEAARATGVTQKTISDAAKTYYLGGKKWKSGGYFWHFIDQ